VVGKRISRWARSAVAATAALTVTVGLAGVVAPASPGGSIASFSFTRLAGPNRFGTAGAIAQAAFPTGVATAIVATGFNYPDALTAAYVAGQQPGKAALLLVNSTSPVPAETLAALTALKVKNVIIMGQTLAVGADVEAALKNTDSTATSGGKLVVTRLGGDTRFTTMKIADESIPAASVGTIGGKATAILVTAFNFADAVTASVAAYAKNLPIIITSATSLSPEAAAVITDLAIKQLLIYGGTAAVATAVETAANALGAATLARFDGVDRADTSRKAAEYFNYSPKVAGFNNTKIEIANGDPAFGGADALALSQFGGTQDHIVTLLLDSATNTSGAQDYLIAHSGDLTKGWVAGGTLVMPDALVGDTGTLTKAAQGAVVTNQTIVFDHAFGDIAVNPASGPFGSPTGESAARQYVATVPASVPLVSVALFPCSTFTKDANGNIFAADPAQNQQALGIGTPVAFIESINGSQNATANGGGPGFVPAGVAAPTFVPGVTPINDKVIIVVNGQAANQNVCPVVFKDPGNNQLTLDLATNTPALTERPNVPFGVGGADVIVPPAAPFGAFNSKQVQLVLPAQKVFTTNAVNAGGLQTYTVKSGDTFNYDGGTGTSQPVTQAQFFEWLSGLATPPNVAGFGPLPAGGGYTQTGDIVNVNSNPSGQSVFTIVRDVPNVVTGLTVTPSDTDNGGKIDDNHLAWNADPNPGVAASVAGSGYLIFRAVVPTGAKIAPLAAFALIGGVNGGTTQFNNQNLVPNTYAYIVLANDSGAAVPGAVGIPPVPGFLRTSPNDAQVSGTIAAAAATPPRIMRTTFTNGAGQAPGPPPDCTLATPGGCRGLLDAGDALTVTTDAAMTPPASNASITLHDKDGTIDSLTNGLNAVFSVGGPGNTVLSISLTANPTLVSNGIGNTTMDTTPPATAVWAIDAITGVGNAAGPINLAASGLRCAAGGGAPPFAVGACGGAGDLPGLPANLTRQIIPNNTAGLITTSGNNERLQLGPFGAARISNLDAGIVVTPPVTINWGPLGTFTDAGLLANTDRIFTYDANGNLIASAPSYNAAAGNSLTSSANFLAGDVLLGNFAKDAGPSNGLPAPTTVLRNINPKPQIVSTVPGACNPAPVAGCPNLGGPGGLTLTLTVDRTSTVVGNGSNVTVYNATNSVLIGTGNAIAGPGGGTGCPGPTGGGFPFATCTYTVTLTAAPGSAFPYAAGALLTVRVAAGTFTSNETFGNNQPNDAATISFVVTVPPPGPLPFISGICNGTVAAGTGTTGDIACPVAGPGTNGFTNTAGQVIIVNGTNFRPGMTWTITGRTNAGAPLTIAGPTVAGGSATQFTIPLPNGGAIPGNLAVCGGTVQLTLTNTDGSTLGSPGDIPDIATFTGGNVLDYIAPAPTLTGSGVAGQPNANGPRAGGTAVTFTGTNFQFGPASPGAPFSCGPTTLHFAGNTGTPITGLGVPFSPADTTTGPAAGVPSPSRAALVLTPDSNDQSNLFVINPDGQASALAALPNPGAFFYDPVVIAGGLGVDGLGIRYVTLFQNGITQNEQVGAGTAAPSTQLLVTWNRAVTCANRAGQRAAFTYTPLAFTSHTGANPVVAVFSGVGANRCTLTLTTALDSNDAGSLTYTPPVVLADNVVGTGDGSPAAASPATAWPLMQDLTTPGFASLSNGGGRIEDALESADATPTIAVRLTERVLCSSVSTSTWNFIRNNAFGAPIAYTAALGAGCGANGYTNSFNLGTVAVSTSNWTAGNELEVVVGTGVKDAQNTELPGRADGVPPRDPNLGFGSNFERGCPDNQDFTTGDHCVVD